MKPTLCEIGPSLDVLGAQTYVKMTLTYTRDRFVTAATTTDRTRHGHYIQVSVRTIGRHLRAARMTSWRPYCGPILTLRRRQLRMYWVRTHARWSRDMWTISEDIQNPIGVHWWQFDSPTLCGYHLATCSPSVPGAAWWRHQISAG